MAKISLKIVGSSKVASLVSGNELNAENILELVQRQKLLDHYEFEYFIFLNGIKVENESKPLHDGDEVLLIPIAVGG